MTGKGYLILPQLFSPDEIREAREIILRHSDSGDPKVTHFHGALFYGLTWHCAMPNHSDADRTGILIQYLPKFVKPMEDQQCGVRADVISEASPILKQLLGFNYPYPQILDRAEAKNEIGRHAEEGQ